MFFKHRTSDRVEIVAARIHYTDDTKLSHNDFQFRDPPINRFVRFTVLWSCFERSECMVPHVQDELRLRSKCFVGQRTNVRKQIKKKRIQVKGPSRLRNLTSPNKKRLCVIISIFIARYL